MKLQHIQNKFRWTCRVATCRDVLLSRLDDEDVWITCLGLQTRACRKLRPTNPKLENKVAKTVNELKTKMQPPLCSICLSYVNPRGVISTHSLILIT